MKKSLNGKWQFKQADKDSWFDATVPGCNYLDLLNLNQIEDPFDGLNEEKCYWVSEKDWEYKKAFTISKEELDFDKINLKCEMLDTICKVYINNILVGKGENCHRIYDFSAKEYLKVGENEIKILFHSPVNYVKDVTKGKATPINSNGQNGIVYIRKPQCHFGWDWGPILPASGITRDIYFEFVNTAKIENISVTQNHFDGKVKLNISCDIAKYGDSEFECKIEVKHPNKDIQSENGNTAEFVIDKPELWWTRELSQKEEQPLYTVVATLYKDGKEFDKLEKSIGLRTITLNRDTDEYGQNFQFILNGVSLFIKGASYIPGDSFITRVGKKGLEKFIDTALFSNMNMIRIWGGGYYECDDFYDICDKKGILVWQDFQFACQAYPFFDKDFLENVKGEIADNVKRISTHPSLALWCGNNEIEAMSSSWMHLREYINWTEIFFHQMLEEEIRKYDKTTSFIPGSPCGIEHNKGVNCDNVGDTHLWGVWHGLQPMNFYRKRMTRFCSEFGFESLPDIKAIEQFANPNDYSLTSPVFTAHQKCNSGNMKMIYYIASRFKLPKNFEDFIYLSQVTQQECIKDATEHWRRNKGRCNGAMYWQFNDCWPVCSWSSIDYYGNYKALQYTARHFNAPLSVSMEDTKENVKIYAINDFNSAKSIKIECSIFDFEDGVKFTKSLSANLNPLESKKITVIDTKKLAKKYNLKQTGIVAKMYSKDKLISEKTVLFYKEKALKLPKATLNTKITNSEDEIKISIYADSFARLVKVESSLSKEHFSDNYFDILPQEIKTVTLPKTKDISEEELINSISVISLSDVETRNMTSEEKLLEVKMLVSPVNIGNCIYHGGIPKDIKIK